MTGLAPAQVVALHVAAPHRVLMIGFAPGHPYIGGLDARLAVPRRASPRLRVEARVGRDRERPDLDLPVRDAGRLERDRTDAARAVRSGARAGNPARAGRRGRVRADLARRVRAHRPGSARDMSLRVLRAGALATVQDLGRRGLQHLGIVPGGAMDPVSHRVANALVGNHADAATLEIALSGPELAFGSRCTGRPARRPVRGRGRRCAVPPIAPGAGACRRAAADRAGRGRLLRLPRRRGRDRRPAGARQPQHLPRRRLRRLAGPAPRARRDPAVCAGCPGARNGALRAGDPPPPFDRCGTVRHGRVVCAGRDPARARRTRRPDHRGRACRLVRRGRARRVLRRAVAHRARLEPDGLSPARAAARARGADRDPVPGDLPRDGPGPAGRAADRPHGRPPDDRRLS